MPLNGLDLLVRASALLSIAWVLTTVLRRQSASLRALVWTAALTGILLLPAASALVPALRVAVPNLLSRQLDVSDAAQRQRFRITPADVPPVSRATNALGVSSVVASASAGRTEGTRPGSHTATENSATRPQDPRPLSASARKVNEIPVTAADEEPTSFASAVDSSGASSGASPVASTFAPVFAAVDWPLLAIVGWLVVALALVCRLVFSHVRLARLVRTTTSVDVDAEAEWQSVIDTLRSSLGISRTVDVRVTDVVGVPAVAGVFRPVLMVPAEAQDWDPEAKRAVVLHELAHVARWDGLCQVISQVACAVYWFVPLVWLAAQRAAMLREQASDDVVLASGVRPSSYAEKLLAVAQLTGNGALESGVLAMAHPRRIRERIVAILDPAARRDHMGLRRVLTAAVAAVGALALVAAIQPMVRAAESVSVTFEPSVPSASAEVSVTNTVSSDEPSTVVPPSLEVEPPMPVAAQSTKPCDGKLSNSSTSMHEDGARKTWTVKMKGPDCTLDMRVEGTVEFNDDFTDVKSLSSGGTFDLDTTESGVRHELSLRNRGGTLERTWRVDGREQPYDAAARAWVAEFLIRLDRRTAVGVDVRLPKLLSQGGVDAVMAETALMSSDFARGKYYTTLLETRRLSQAELSRVLDQAVAMTKSDFYANQLITAVSKQGMDNPGVRTAALRLIDTMESDHYRSEGIQTVVGAGSPSSQDLRFLVQMMPKVESDFYKLQILQTILKGDLSVRDRSSLAEAARTIESDHYATEFLKALSQGGLDDAGRRAFFEVLGTIESDHYALESLKALIPNYAPSRDDLQLAIRALDELESDHYHAEGIKVLLTVRDLTEQDLLQLVRSSASMGSDHYESEALRATLGHRAITDRVRSAVLDEATHLSRTYRTQVERAAGR